ncbi:MAG: hypothetical protein WD771_04405 [Gemmatimonadaceae bacterium]
MPSLLVTALFWIAAAAVVIAQAMILRSTARAWRAGGAAPSALERGFAVAPALVLVVVLWLSWRAATAPPTIQVDLTGPAPTSIRL